MRKPENDFVRACDCVHRPRCPAALSAGRLFDQALETCYSVCRRQYSAPTQTRLHDHSSLVLGEIGSLRSHEQECFHVAIHDGQDPDVCGLRSGVRLYVERAAVLCDRGFTEPRRCPVCRASRKAARGDTGGGGYRWRRWWLLERWRRLRPRPARDVLRNVLELRPRGPGPVPPERQPSRSTAATASRSSAKATNRPSVRTEARRSAGLHRFSGLRRRAPGARPRLDLRWRHSSGPMASWKSLQAIV